jgi:hypothetical protein
MRAGDEHIAATPLDQPLYAAKPARLQAVGRGDRRAWHDELEQRVDHLVAGKRIAAARREHRIEHQRHPGVVRQHFGDRADIVHRAEHAELERGYAHIVEHAARLVCDPRGIDREDAFHAARVLHGERGHHRQRMAAHRREREQIGLHACAAGGIGSGEAEHDRRRKRHELISGTILLVPR